MTTAPYGIISDTHHHQWSAFATTLPSGVNSRLQATLDETMRCADEVRNAGGDTIIHAGDIFHVRGSVSPLVLNPTIDCFKEIISTGVKVILLAGNHDAELKDVTRLSSAITVLEGVGCSVANEPLLVGNKWLIPWYQNIAELKSIIETPPPNHHEVDLILHAPIDDVIIGIPSHGLDATYLGSLGFKRVFSGHYHNHKDFGNGVYSIGALTHLSWSDVGSKAGFLIVGDDVKWRASHAPSFVEITPETDPSEVELIVDGNYVRAKIKTTNSSDVENSRQFLMDCGAKGVVIIAEKDAVASKREGGATIKSGASLEVSIGDFIKSQKHPNAEALSLLCSEILNEARGE